MSLVPPRGLAALAMAIYTGPFKYDERAGFFATAFRLRHTVVCAILQRRAFWTILSFHVMVCLLRSSVWDECVVDSPDWEMGRHKVHVVSACTTFLEVFYTNECWKRFQLMYHTTRTLLTITYSFIIDLRVTMERTSMPHFRLACRYMISSVMLMFYEKDGCAKPQAWTSLLRLGLLTDDEVGVLRGLSPTEKTLYLSHWCGDVVTIGHALAMKKDNAPPNIIRSLRATLRNVRWHHARARDLIAMPVPFQYFHLLNFMVVINLVLWAYCMGCAMSAIYSLVFVAASLVFMGMFELASAFLDPFGTDEVDFRVGTWLTEWLRQCVELVERETTAQAEDRWIAALSKQSLLNPMCVDADLFKTCNFADSPRQRTSCKRYRFTSDWTSEDLEIAYRLFGSSEGPSSGDDDDDEFMGTFS